MARRCKPKKNKSFDKFDFAAYAIRGINGGPWIPSPKEVEELRGVSLSPPRRISKHAT